MIRPAPFTAALLILAAAALSACDDGVFVNRSESPTAYSGMFYVWSTAAMGTNQVVVYNSPYPPDPTIKGVLDAAHARYQSDQYKFFAGQPPAEWNGYTVVLAFADGIQGNQNLCVNRNEPLRPTKPGWTSIFAEYCLGTTLVTEANAYTKTVSGIDDPRFAKLVGGVVSALFEYHPPPNPHSSGVRRLGG